MTYYIQHYYFLLFKFSNSITGPGSSLFPIYGLTRHRLNSLNESYDHQTCFVSNLCPYLILHSEDQSDNNASYKEYTARTGQRRACNCKPSSSSPCTPRGHQHRTELINSDCSLHIVLMQGTRACRGNIGNYSRVHP